MKLLCGAKDFLSFELFSVLQLWSIKDKMKKNANYAARRSVVIHLVLIRNLVISNLALGATIWQDLNPCDFL